MQLDFAAPLKGLFAGITGTIATTLALRRVLPRLLPRPARPDFLPELVVGGMERRCPPSRREP
ncbi:MAG: hypothetical protein KY466_08195 [Gemmatimonadetes bacterium]|nr:hypothetical protein [Gemmatimonadota bacterium]